MINAIQPLSSATSQQFTTSAEPHMLYERIIKQGTINEKDGKPEPQFALPATVNWMHALRILATDEIVDFQDASFFYQEIGRRNIGTCVENTVFEQLFPGLQHLSALEQIRNGRNAEDYVRIGPLACYYGISSATFYNRRSKFGGIDTR